MHDIPPKASILVFLFFKISLQFGHAPVLFWSVSQFYRTIFFKIPLQKSFGLLIVRRMIFWIDPTSMSRNACTNLWENMKSVGLKKKVEIEKVWWAFAFSDTEHHFFDAFTNSSIWLVCMGERQMINKDKGASLGILQGSFQQKNMGQLIDLSA